MNRQLRVYGLDSLEPIVVVDNIVSGIELFIPIVSTGTAQTVILEYFAERITQLFNSTSVQFYKGDSDGVVHTFISMLNFSLLNMRSCTT